jgi:capsid protein
VSTIGSVPPEIKFLPPNNVKAALRRRRAAAAGRGRIEARYDNARSDHENDRRWGNSDYLSAKAANSYQVRKLLRMRSRYELASGPFLFGIATDNADDLIDTGPTLALTTPSKTLNKAIEEAWRDYYQEIDFTGKLKTAKLAKTIDGEGFNVFKTAESLENPVKLYPCDIEADQVTSLMPSDMIALWLDGVILDPVTGQPAKYTVLDHHPGDFFFSDLNSLKWKDIPARNVIHWFDKFRPGQVRGLPTFTPSLDLFTDLRTFRKSTVDAGTKAAQMGAIVLEQAGGVGPPASIDDDGDDGEWEPWDHVDIHMGQMTTVPAGLTMKSLQSNHPATTYGMFQLACLGEACRPLSYPLNLALGSSREFNFSSSKIDHINYRNGLLIERAECEKHCVEKLFRAWFDEAKLIPGYLPEECRGMARPPKHEWHWPGFAPLDPVADAQADHDRIAHGTLTWQQFWAARGHDWREMFKQQFEELKEIIGMGLQFGDPPKKTISEKEDENGQPVDAAFVARFLMRRLTAAYGREHSRA